MARRAVRNGGGGLVSSRYCGVEGVGEQLASRSAQGHGQQGHLRHSGLRQRDRGNMGVLGRGASQQRDGDAGVGDSLRHPLQ